jgi:hypothetical protein
MSTSKYNVIKAQSTTFTGRTITVWNVVDATDGYVYDTFSLRRDAVAWVARAVAK